MSKETLKNISEITGYSISTISRVLSGKGQQHRISEGTIKLILEKAEEMNYTPNSCAQFMRNNHTNTIGLLIPNISNNFFSNVANQIINIAQQHNYQVITIDTRENEEIEKQALSSLLLQNIDGAIIIPSGHNISELKELQAKIPVVLIDRYIKGISIPVVSVDNYKGAYKLTELLIHNGHQRILAIQGSESSSANQERVRGYREAMETHHLEEYIQIKGNEFSTRNGYIETNIALQQEPRPSAIFTFSNNIFIGCMKALQLNKVKMPSQLSVVTFDDDPYMDVMNPAITRIMQPIKEECRLAFKILLKSIEKGEETKSCIFLAPTLKMRDSISSINDEK